MKEHDDRAERRERRRELRRIVMRTTVFQHGIPVPALLVRTKRGDWTGRDEDGNVASGDSKEECADELSQGGTPMK